MSGNALPVLTIGGYLGSGKTTLLNHLLRHADGRRLAILVNEFGALPIDADLIEAESDDMISIAGGCICCSFGNDLLAALRDMSSMSPRPDCVVIEASGVAIPGAITASVSLLDAVRPDGTVVVVDAETVQRAARDDYIGDTITRQLSDAEIVVVNKLDLVNDDTAASLAQWLTTMAPNAVQIPARFGQVAPEALLGSVSNPSPGRPSPHSDALFSSVVLDPPKPVDAATLARTLATGDHGIIRAKGHVTGADGQVWLIQTVGKRWQADPADGPFSNGVVCIGFRDQLDATALANLDLTTPLTALSNR